MYEVHLGLFFNIFNATALLLSKRASTRDAKNDALRSELHNKRCNFQNQQSEFVRQNATRCSKHRNKRRKSSRVNLAEERTKRDKFIYWEQKCKSTITLNKSVARNLDCGGGAKLNISSNNV